MEITDSQVGSRFAEPRVRRSTLASIGRARCPGQLARLRRSGRVVGFIRTVVRIEHFFFAVDMHRRSGGHTRRSLSEVISRATEVIVLGDSQP